MWVFVSDWSVLNTFLDFASEVTERRFPVKPLFKLFRLSSPYRQTNTPTFLILLQTMRRHIDPWPYMTKSSIYVILNHHGQECSGESSPCNRTRLIERMMNYAGFDFSYFLSPKHLIKMVMNFAGFKSEDILDNINDKNFSNFTMVSWMELVVQLYYLQL